MKIAVVGGGSTYTPELVDGFARLPRRARRRRARARSTRPRDRLEVVGGFARRMLRPRTATRARLTWTTDLDAAWTAPTVVLIQLRVGGQAARHRRRDVPARVRLRRPGDDRRGRAGQGAAHGAGGARRRRRAYAGTPRRAPGSSTSPTRSASSPARSCSTPATARSGCATWRSASSGGSPRCSASHPTAVAPRPRRPQPPDLGAGGVRRRRRRAARAARRPRRRHRRATSSCPRALMAGSDAIPSYYLRYFYAHDAGGRRRSSSAATRAAEVAAIERELLTMYADPALVEKPELLDQRGGAYYSEAAVGLVASLLSGDGADARRATSATTARCPSCPTTRSSRCPAASTPPAPRRSPVPAFDERTRGLVAHVADYERAGPGRRDARRPDAGLRRAAGAPAGRPVRPG